MGQLQEKLYKNTLSLKEAINECENKGDSYAY